MYIVVVGLPGSPKLRKFAPRSVRGGHPLPHSLGPQVSVPEVRSMIVLCVYDTNSASTGYITSYVVLRYLDTYRAWVCDVGVVIGQLGGAIGARAEMWMLEVQWYPRIETSPIGLYNTQPHAIGNVTPTSHVDHGSITSSRGSSMTRTTALLRWQYGRFLVSHSHGASQYSSRETAT